MKYMYYSMTWDELYYIIKFINITCTFFIYDNCCRIHVPTKSNPINNRNAVTIYFKKEDIHSTHSILKELL